MCLCVCVSVCARFSEECCLLVVDVIIYINKLINYINLFAKEWLCVDGNFLHVMLVLKSVMFCTIVSACSRDIRTVTLTVRTSGKQENSF